MIKEVFNIPKMTLTHFWPKMQLLPFGFVGQYGWVDCVGFTHADWVDLTDCWQLVVLTWFLIIRTCSTQTLLIKHQMWKLLEHSQLDWNKLYNVNSGAKRFLILKTKTFMILTLYYVCKSWLTRNRFARSRESSSNEVKLMWRK